ncbi:hypothetical protein FHR22_001212 [Sphingopyxis panaciterrae]|uniref:hypothetical protein n=1 Tax=Sphingopyxis panaciterrae TaxID=363841 RepID=UPI00141D9115|nr:hypothetical protein [Sphingopyxis panaciterrae]NIJ36563.1 hypothetical protein [Sphingopyxis panaciterrae]
MSATSDFYLAQAEKCETEATESALTQVRDRNLRAAQAWRTMAERLVQTEATRARQVEAAAAKAQAVADAA